MKAGMVKTVPAAAAIIGWLGCSSGLASDRAPFLHSYLFAYLVFLHLALGCFALAQIHNLTGGAWGHPLRRSLEAGAACLPWMALLFLPIALGLREIYPWARPGALAAPEFRHAAAYLSPPFFLIRAAAYFAIWALWGRLLKTRARTAVSAPGLILYGLTAQFAAFDWCMSLEPEWHSTAYGFLFIASEAPAVLALLILVAGTADGADRDRAASLFAPARLYDVGNLLMAFVLVWAYLSFMQFLIIWSGNLPEEISWYLRRSSGGWQWLAAALALFQFAAPFLLLLFRSIKRRPRILLAIAGLLLGAHVADVFWTVAPAFTAAGLRVHAQDLFCLLAVGGAWGWMYAWQYAGWNAPAATEAGYG